MAKHSSAQRVRLEVDMRATYSYADLWIWNDDEAEERRTNRFRWTCDLYMDVAKVVSAIADQLESVQFHLGTFKDLEPWLEQQVLGDRCPGPKKHVDIKRRSRVLAEKIPSYHYYI